MPTQVAPPPAMTSPALTAPLVPIPAYRVQSFAHGVAERMRAGASDGQAEAQVLAAIARERLALAAAIHDSDFRAEFALAYEKYQAVVNPATPPSLQACARATDDIIAHRINDARVLAQLVTQPEFVAQAWAIAAAAPTARPDLAPEKIAEMIERFAEDTSPRGIDGITHAQQAMMGHRVGHLALAQAYSPQGGLQAVLEKTLAKSWPEASDVDRARLAADWLAAREKPARATVAMLQEGGDVYEAVLERVHRAAQAKEQATTGMALPAPMPTMGLATSLAANSALTPAQIERSKDRIARANAWAYTINHAISCGTTDIFIQPFVSQWFSHKVEHGSMPRGLRWINNLFEKHDHGHTHGADCDHHHDHKPALKSNAKHWFGGEFWGDVGAVPLTVMTQRFFPGFMHGIRNLLEPLVGGFFRKGANHDAQRWANRQTTPVGDADIAAKAQELYQYEMQHLPQAVMWNAFSIPINLFAQRRMGSKQGWGAMALGKTFGSLVSNTALIGGRAMMPETFHRWDNFNSTHVVAPVSRAVDRVFGVDEETRARAGGPQAHVQQVDWQARMQPSTTMAATTTLH